MASRPGPRTPTTLWKMIAEPSVDGAVNVAVFADMLTDSEALTVATLPSSSVEMAVRLQYEAPAVLASAISGMDDAATRPGVAEPFTVHVGDGNGAPDVQLSTGARVRTLAA